MTPREIQTLDFVRERILRAGFAPSLSEIGEHMGGLAKGLVHSVVSSLVEQGLLIRQPHRARGLALPGLPDLRAAPTEALQAELARRGVVPGALSRPERRAIAGAGEVSCAADGCGVAVGRGHAFCLEHWRSISRETQETLLDAHAMAVRIRNDKTARTYQEAFSQAKLEAERGRRAA